MPLLFADRLVSCLCARGGGGEVGGGVGVGVAIGWRQGWIGLKNQSVVSKQKSGGAA